jgi:hypothetical protein
MLKLPLLLVADPKSVKSGPIVRIAHGKWDIVCKGIVDTVIRIVSLPLTLESKEIVNHIDGPCDVQCIVLSPGKEKNISVFAEKAC